MLYESSTIMLKIIYMDVIIFIENGEFLVLFHTTAATNGITVLAKRIEKGIGSAAVKVVADCILCNVLKDKRSWKTNKAIKGQTTEHKKSLRMKELSEKKCAQLASEIREDKRCRASLQRQLKKDSWNRRSEQRAAKQQATCLLGNSKKFKIELQKLKEAATRQAVVLRKKEVEALIWQKRLVEKQRRQNKMLYMKAKVNSNNRGTQKNDVFENRLEELMTWLEREIEVSATLLQIKNEIEEQDALLEITISK